VESELARRHFGSTFVVLRLRSGRPKPPNQNETEAKTLSEAEGSPDKGGNIGSELPGLSVRYRRTRILRTARNSSLFPSPMAKKIIVTTTINPPTTATLKFCEKKDWDFLIVGDTKTPHEAYEKLQKQFPQVIYLSPEYQEKQYKELSDCIGWKTIRRRNIGFVEAYKRGAEILATVDDDNIPYDNWGEDIFVNRETECDLYEPAAPVFDPLSITQSNFVWHRGYPIDYLQERLQVSYKGKIKRKPLVQANLWDGDPDIDAIARLCFKPIMKYSDIEHPFCSNKIGPFNSQNTMLARSVLPHYAVLPGVGRMDDIWMSYIIQHLFPNSVIYDKATVYQDRNIQNLVDNLQNEIMGYRQTKTFIQDLSNYERYLPDETKRFYEIYRRQYV
jgi:hypothetical protein